MTRAKLFVLNPYQSGVSLGFRSKAGSAQAIPLFLKGRGNPVYSAMGF